MLIEDMAKIPSEPPTRFGTLPQRRRVRSTDTGSESRWFSIPSKRKTASGFVADPARSPLLEMRASRRDADRLGFFQESLRHAMSQPRV